MTNCNTDDLTIENILSDQMVRLAMRRDGVTDEELRRVILQARAAVMNRPDLVA